MPTSSTPPPKPLPDPLRQQLARIANQVLRQALPNLQPTLAAVTADMTAELNAQLAPTFDALFAPISEAVAQAMRPQLQLLARDMLQAIRPLVDDLTQDDVRRIRDRYKADADAQGEALREPQADPEVTVPTATPAPSFALLWKAPDIAIAMGCLDQIIDILTGVRPDARDQLTLMIYVLYYAVMVVARDIEQRGWRPD